MTGYFLTHYEEVYGSDFVQEVEDLFGSPFLAESFFGVRAQLDLLTTEDGVDLSNAAFKDKLDWTIQGFIEATQETAAIARAQERPSARAITTLASALMELFHEAVVLAGLAKARQEDDEITIKRLEERLRCLDVIKEGQVASKIASGSAPKPIQGEMIEVDQNGDHVGNPGALSKPVEDPDMADDTIVTPSGLVIRG